MSEQFDVRDEAVSRRMKRIRSSGTGLELAMQAMLDELGLKYETQPRLDGRPDFRILNSRVLVFCDSSFWHGRREADRSGRSFSRNRAAWASKLERNRRRDIRVNARLRNQGWSVWRFWDDDIHGRPAWVKKRLARAVNGQCEDVPTAVDLFSGAGGLTLGLKRAGFKVCSAVEVDAETAETYEANHPDVKLLTDDVKALSGDDVLEAAGVKQIDLIAGCPPCQGFSKLTDKCKKDDPRNLLVLEMARLIVEIRPQMIMMENVPGLTHRGKKLLDGFLETLEAAGYVLSKDILQLADYGVPQSRRRLVVLGGLGFRVDLPTRTHARVADPEKGLEQWRTLRDAIGTGTRPVTLSAAMRRGGPGGFGWHVVRDLSNVSKDRLRAVRAGRSRADLPVSLRPKCHRGSYVGFQNVYARMSWKSTPPTMTGGCTTPCKGRFGHPTQLRTISVREAALIQTFPEDYRLVTDKMRVACELVGNALPPLFAEQAARACLEAMPARRCSDVS